MDQDVAQFIDVAPVGLIHERYGLARLAEIMATGYGGDVWSIYWHVENIWLLPMGYNGAGLANTDLFCGLMSSIRNMNV